MWYRPAVRSLSIGLASFEKAGSRYSIGSFDGMVEAVSAGNKIYGGNLFTLVRDFL